MGVSFFFMRKKVFVLLIYHTRLNNKGGRNRMSGEDGNASSTGVWKIGADPRFEVQVLPKGIVRASARMSLMRASVARPFCERIQDAARLAHAHGLVMDLNTFGRVTPAAGLYALGQLKGMVVERIALVGGNAFMRTFARVVLTLGRFGQFAFFEGEPEAITWAAEGKDSLER